MNELQFSTNYQTFQKSNSEELTTFDIEMQPEFNWVTLIFYDGAQNPIGYYQEIVQLDKVTFQIVEPIYKNVEDIWVYVNGIYHDDVEFGADHLITINNLQPNQQYQIILEFSLKINNNYPDGLLNVIAKDTVSTSTE